MNKGPGPLFISWSRTEAEALGILCGWQKRAGTREHRKLAEEVFLDVRAPTTPDKREHWWSVDLVRELVTGDLQETATAEDHAAWLADNLDEVVRRFSPDELEASEVTVDELVRRRAKRSFG